MANKTTKQKDKNVVGQRAGGQFGQGSKDHDEDNDPDGELVSSASYVAQGCIGGSANDNDLVSRQNTIQGTMMTRNISVVFMSFARATATSLFIHMLAIQEPLI